MAGSLTDAFEVDILNAIVGRATTVLTTTPFAATYIALFTTMPTDSTAGTEVSTTSTGYARATATGKWGAPTSGSPSSVTNNAVITFPTATASWGTAIQGFGLFASSSGGTLLAYGTLTDQTKVVGSGDTLSFAVGALTLTAD